MDRTLKRIDQRDGWLLWTGLPALRMFHRMGPNRTRRFLRADARLYRDVRADLKRAGLWPENTCVTKKGPR